MDRPIRRPRGSRPARRDRFTYHFANPSAIDTPGLVPHFFEQRYVADNVAWHAVASVALYLLVLELFASNGLALATAALFGVHPVHTEAVDGIVGRAELMSAFFAFLALLYAWRVVRDDPPGAWRPALAAAFLGLALLSKEQAIIIPAVPLFWLLPLTRGDRRVLIRRTSFVRLMGCLAAAAVAYLALRGAVLGSPIATGAIERAGVVVDNPVAGAHGAARVLTPLLVFGEALRVLVVPKTLSADYGFAQIPLVTSWDLATAALALVLAGLVAGAFLLRRKAPAASFGIAFFLLSWTLTSNLPLVIGTIFAERLLYLSSAIAIGYGVCGRGTCSPQAAGSTRRGSARSPSWRSSGSRARAHGREIRIGRTTRRCSLRLPRPVPVRARRSTATPPSCSPAGGRKRPSFGPSARSPCIRPTPPPT